MRNRIEIPQDIIEKLSKAQVPGLETPVIVEPRKAQIMQRRALGQKRSQIASDFGITQNAVRNAIAEACCESEQPTSIHLVGALFDSGQIDKELVGNTFVFDNYSDLDDQQKQLIKVVTHRAFWADTLDAIAHNLQVPAPTLKDNLKGIYKILGVDSLFRARVFMFLNPYTLQEEIKAQNP